MDNDGVSLWLLLIPAGIGLLIASQVLLLKFRTKTAEDEVSAYKRVEVGYCNPFTPTKVTVGPNQDAKVRCCYRGLLYGSFVPPFLLFWLAASDNAFSFFCFALGATALIGSVQQLWTFWRWPDEPCEVVSVELNQDHLVVLLADGDRHVFVYDGTMQVMVSCEQDLIGVWPVKVHHRTELEWRIKDATHLVSFPFTVDGCGPLLSLCRQSGVQVNILNETPIQKKFAEFAAGVGDWGTAQPTYVPRPRGRHAAREMVCGSCGAKAMYEGSTANRACDYCGAVHLTPL